MVSEPHGSISSEIQCNVAKIKNHRHYLKYENCRWQSSLSKKGLQSHYFATEDFFGVHEW
jgi:hypothetical protein